MGAGHHRLGWFPASFFRLSRPACFIWSFLQPWLATASRTWSLGVWLWLCMALSEPRCRTPPQIDAAMTRAFDPGDRTYYVSDERLAVFAALSLEERLRWVEELATFLRLAKLSAAQDTLNHAPPS